MAYTEEQVLCDFIYFKFKITNIKKRCPFQYRGLDCKSRKLRDTWSNRQVWPWSTKRSRAKANRVLPKNALVTANTLFHQHERRLYTWTSQYQNQIDYILVAKDGENLHSQQKQDQELPVALIMNSLLQNAGLN